MSFKVRSANLSPPAPPPNPPPTGSHPMFWVTAARQAVWAAMKANYDANPSSPSSLGGQWFKQIKNNADENPFARYLDNGRMALLIYQMTGDVTYAAKAWTKFKTAFAYPTPFNQTFGRNETREYTVELAVFYDWLYAYLTDQERADFRTWLWNIANIILNKVQNVNWGTRLGDSDETVGHYLGLACIDLATGSTFLTQSWDRGDGVTVPVGGLASTAGNSGYSSMRNSVRWIIETLSAGGSWPESSEYNLGTPGLVMMGTDAIRTATGIEYFPEMETLIPNLVAESVHDVVPELTDSFQWGDVEHDRQIDWFVRGQLLWMLQGQLVRLAHADLAYFTQFILDLQTANSITVFSSLARQFYWADPSVVGNAGWATHFGKKFYAAGQGIYIQHAGWSPNNDSAWCYIMPPQAAVDHFQSHQADIRARRKGVWMLDHPIGYQLAPKGQNLVDIVNCGISNEASGTATQEAVDGEYGYASGLNCGVSPVVYAGYGINAPTYLHENGRTAFYFPATDHDLWLVLDRVNATDPRDSADFTTEYQYQSQRDQINAARGTKDVIWHTFANPTVSGKVISWDRSGMKVKIEWIGTTPTYTTIAEDATTLPGYVDSSEYHYFVSAVPAVKQQWDVFKHVVRVYDASDPVTAITAIDSSAGQAYTGLIVKRTGLNDVICLISGIQGPNVSTTYVNGVVFDGTKFNTVQAAKLLTTGSTFAFTQGSGTAKVYLSDLKTTKTWSYTYDGGGSNALTVSSQGMGKIISVGAGVHTIVLTGV